MERSLALVAADISHRCAASWQPANGSPTGWVQAYTAQQLATLEHLWDTWPAFRATCLVPECALQTVAPNHCSTGARAARVRHGGGGACTRFLQVPAPGGEMLGCRERCTCPWPVGAQAWVGELASPPGAGCITLRTYCLPPTQPLHLPTVPSCPPLPSSQPPRATAPC